MSERLSVTTFMPEVGPDVYHVSRFWEVEGTQYTEIVAGPFSNRDECLRALAEMKAGERQEGGHE